ncbi:tyrosine-type recombinase/integrase [Burkholderia cenocepacia]|uniref:tyrosine-type recombinase/integrase n=1 Tax=Burkholderia cenocepacia TaxID=95486 RepID=UPI002875C2C1|nr:tyrosine-type recombinase/integrase [Burkholderia cenocepacia]MDS0808959.1 tyrosine-type recombinase/integrase [Burkholderia cenocepacia]
MAVRSVPLGGRRSVELLDDAGEPVAVVNAYLRHLAARDCSPNTQVAYAHDLQHLWRFLSQQHLDWHEFRVWHAVEFLGYLRSLKIPLSPRRRSIAEALTIDGKPMAQLAPTTVNRILAAVSSFYDFAILSAQLESGNPLEKTHDHQQQRVTNRHRPFMDGASRQRPLRRRLSVKTVDRLPRPMSDEQINALFAELHCKRDHAIVRLMLDGGLRPGEALGLHLEDIRYGQRRLMVRYRNDHPKGVRAKSRFERVVDLHDPATLEAVNTYIMTERPKDGDSPFVFLVGGAGKRRLEPPGYPALFKLFIRACERAGIREPWVTPHSLRHTHATRMWEAGMRELTLQKRLGHASPESTRIYTRVSDREVVADYRRALGLEHVESSAEASTRTFRT